MGAWVAAVAYENDHELSSETPIRSSDRVALCDDDNSWNARHIPVGAPQINETHEIPSPTPALLSAHDGESKMGDRYISCGCFGVRCLNLPRGDSTPCGEHPLRSRSFQCTPFLLLWIDHQLIESLDMQLWANIYTMEITSDECLTEVRSLLSCRSNMNIARSFRGIDAQTFIDFLDQVSRSCLLHLEN